MNRTMLALMAKYRLNALIRFFRVRTAAKVIVASLFILLFLAIAAGIYYFFYRGIGFIGADRYFGQALLYFVYETYLLILFFLSGMGTMINGLFRLFKSDNDDWIMASPQGGVLAAEVWLSAVWQALWPFCAIALPLVFALWQALGLGLAGLAANLVSAALTIVVAVSLSLSCLYGLAWLIAAAGRRFPGIRPSGRALSLAVFAFVALFFVLFASVGLPNDLVFLLEAENLAQSQAGVSRLAAHFGFLPTHLFASTLYYWQTGHGGLLFAFHVQLWLLAIFLTAVWFKLSAGLGAVWQAYRSGQERTQSRQTAGRVRAGKAAGFGQGPYHALFKKEALVFFRNTRGLFWLAFLLFFWLIQAVINRKLSGNISDYGLSIGQAPVIVPVLQVLTAAYFIAAFALRFVFPAFSQEGRCAWILSSAPLCWRKVFYAKLAFYNLLFVCLGLLIASFGLADSGLVAAALASLVVLIVTLSLSLGMLFPDFETDDPSALGTSLPGLGLIFASLLFGAIFGWSLYLKLSGLTPVFFYAVWLGAAVLALLFAVLAPLRYGRIDQVKRFG